MSSINQTSVSLDPLSNEPSHEPLRQNNVGNSGSVSVAVVDDSTQHTEGKEMEQAIADHYPNIPNLATFSESMPTSSAIGSPLEGRIALQPRELNRDIERASAMLTACRLAGSSSEDISRTANFIRTIITRATTQLAATSHDSLEEPKGEVKSLIEYNESIRDMTQQGYNNQAILNTLQATLKDTKNIIEGHETIAAMPLPTSLQTGRTSVLDPAIDAAADSGSEWGQYDNLSDNSSTSSSRRSHESDNTSGEENELVRRPNTQNLQGLVNNQQNNP